MGIIEGTTGGGDQMTLPAGPCFVSGAENFDVALGEVVLGMMDGQISADYSGDPADQLVNGLIRGFVTEDVARMVRLPPDELLVGGQPVANLLQDADKDVGPNGETGWWFYLNFTAQTVPWTDLE